MNLQEFIKNQNFSKDTETVKLKFLKSIYELLLTPKHENLKAVIKHLSILAKSYHISFDTRNIRAKKDNGIERKLLIKTSEIIQNGKGYTNLLPEMFRLIILYAKIKSIKLTF